MLQYFEVTRDAPWFPQVKALYESAFPANERQHPDTRIVVDIEVEEDSKDAEELERRNRRRDFYLRNGFDSSPVDYVWQGEHYRLLSAGGTVTEKDFRDFWKEILKDIHGAKYP